MPVGFDPVTDVFQLLYADDNTLDFGVLNGSGIFIGDTVTFTVPDGLLLDGYYTLQLTSVPEPGACTLLALGAAALASRVRRRKAA